MPGRPPRQGSLVIVHLRVTYILNVLPRAGELLKQGIASFIATVVCKHLHNATHRISAVTEVGTDGAGHCLQQHSAGIHRTQRPDGQHVLLNDVVRGRPCLQEPFAGGGAQCGHEVVLQCRFRRQAYLQVQHCRAAVREISDDAEHVLNALPCYQTARKPRQCCHPPLCHRLIVTKHILQEPRRHGDSPVHRRWQRHRQKLPRPKPRQALGGVRLDSRARSGVHHMSQPQYPQGVCYVVQPRHSLCTAHLSHTCCCGRRIHFLLVLRVL
mmetsp:Transcript_13423/g.40601  ORF Transcript_13423/g.40601 Transcript_13423/m.40601 type:complete len:269 (+) Transcript_13423:1-807(+)